MNKHTTLFSILFFFLSSICMFGQQPINLVIDTQNSKDLKLTTINENELEITTTGRNGFLQLNPFQVEIPKDRNVLSFDYFCATGLDYIVVIANNKVTRVEESMVRLPIAEGWSTYSVDVSEQLKDCHQVGDNFSLMIAPVNSRTTVMRLRNVYLRSYTEKELTQMREKKAKDEREKRMETDLKEYLHKDYASQIKQVSVESDKIIIEGSVEKGAHELFLCEVPMFSDLTEKEFLQQIPLNKAGKFKHKIDRYTLIEGLQYDRLYSRWVLAQKVGNDMQIASQGRYADKVNSLYHYKAEKVRSKKGLGGFHLNDFQSDLDSLQITSVTVNIWLSGFLKLTPGNDNIPFEYNGRTYYADRKSIESLDKTLLTASQHNLIVNAIILISPERNTADKKVGRLMEHPDFNPAGIYTMPNMTTLESLNIYAAAIDFLASRYGRADRKYGRIHHWIAHNEVDAGWVWTNAGVKTSQLFMDDYMKSLRLLYLTARKYNPNSEVFVTLTHYWQSRHNQYCYPSARILELLLDYTRTEGDFQWGLALHPYPESLFEPKTWLDKAAQFNYNTPQITFKNLEVIDAWIKRPEVLYKGKQKRTLFLSEQNPNSKDYSEKALNEQAACMAYVWKKLQRLDGIDAYQMHNWIDNRAEGGLRIGVRKFTDEASDPGGRKPAWFIYRDACTDREEQSFEFAKDIIGIKSWEEIHYKGEIK